MRITALVVAQCTPNYKNDIVNCELQNQNCHQKGDQSNALQIMNIMKKNNGFISSYKNQKLCYNRDEIENY